MKFLLFIFLFIPLLIAKEELELKRKDINETFEEMLALHVEHREMSPLLIARALKVYLEQFDPLKIYLLEDEVKTFSSLNQKKLEKAIVNYKKGDLSTFESVNALVFTAIARGKQYREEISKELILSMQTLKNDGANLTGETYLSYASNQQQLRARLEKLLTRVLLEEKQMNAMKEWTPAQREKIFNLWQKRFERSEEMYVGLSETQGQKESHFSFHTLRALAKSLDAHSAYFSFKEATEMRVSLEKQFEGIGVVLREGVDGILIVDMIKGGPAQRSGKVEVGDQVIQIQGKPVAEMSYEEVLDSMRLNNAPQVVLGLKKKNDQNVHTVTLVREKIRMSEDRLQAKSTPFGKGNIGILTLPSFYEGTESSSAEIDMREAIKKLKREGPLKGIILDFRENGGGFLLQAVKVAGLFITRGVIAISKYSRGEIKYLRNLDGRMYFDGPVIVLTSKASASSAEIVAQALQDYGVAIVVGDERTYGKGTIQYQTVTDTNAKSFYKVTIGRYYTASGRSTQIDGVKADIVVPTIFSSYKIGECFLEYPLPSDHVAAAFEDPLSDIDHKSRTWFQKNYLPNLHKPQDHWKKALAKLQANSQYRLSKDKNFTLFLKEQEKSKGRSPRTFQRDPHPVWGDEDLQLEEAIRIMKDMILLQNRSI